MQTFWTPVQIAESLLQTVLSLISWDFDCWTAPSFLWIFSHPFHLLFNFQSCHLHRSCWFKTNWGHSWGPEDTPILSIWHITTLCLEGELQSTEFKDEWNVRGHMSQVFYMCLPLIVIQTDLRIFQWQKYPTFFIFMLIDEYLEHKKCSITRPKRKKKIPNPATL